MKVAMKLMEKKNEDLQKNMHCEEKMKMVWKNKYENKCKDDTMKNKFLSQSDPHQQFLSLKKEGGTSSYSSLSKDRHPHRDRILSLATISISTHRLYRIEEAQNLNDSMAHKTNLLLRICLLCYNNLLHPYREICRILIDDIRRLALNMNASIAFASREVNRAANDLARLALRSGTVISLASLSLKLRYVMPPKDSVVRRKSRVDMREEFHLALLQQQQPSQAPQPSQHAPQTSQQAPQSSAQVDGSPDSAQELPVLPLVLPLPSAHSTTGSTGPAPPARSIRCSFATTHVPTDSDTAAGASSSNKRRGVVLGKKTAAITKEKGRTPVTYEDSIRGPPFSVRSRFVTDLSAYIKDRCPMLHPTWHDLPVTERTRLLDFLSVNYDIDHRRRELTGWIDEKAANRFRQWKSSCQANWQELGDSPLPVEFAHRLAEWQWLCDHFRDPGFQRRSVQMKAIRASTNKRPHSGGARPFAARAEEYTKKGEQALHAKTYIDMYKKFDPEGTSRVQQASNEAVASLMESMPPIEDTSDGTSPASVTAPPRLSVDVEIGLMERVVGPSRGTRVPGLGSGVAKQPRTRGPSRPEPRNAAIEEEFARLRANQKELEERLQQERRDRQERERQLERERQDRDRERLEFEARIQAQLAEMARQMNMRAPPSDGSNAG
ncbi:hypothetical protein LguiA_009005 [Lonicera macranthoides]